MGAIKQGISWQNSGLNYDEDKRVMPVGDSDARLNVTTNELGREFVISNMKGTVKKSHTFTHHADYNDAVYKVIGSCYDDNRDAVYMFIYSSAGNDSILRFNFSDNSFDKIAWDHTDLGFDADYPITDAYMIGDFLHWNPRTTSPRVINVVWAYYDFISYGIDSLIVGAQDFVPGDYVRDNNKVYVCVSTIARWNRPTSIDGAMYYNFVDFCYDDVYPVNAADINPATTAGEYIDYRAFYNTPGAMSARPFASLLSNTDADANYIRGNIFQFTYRFYVPGQGFTTAAPFSDMIVNENDESLTGEAIEEITTNNYIRVGFPVSDVYTDSGVWLFEFVEILFRKNAEEEWRIADTIYHDDAASSATQPIAVGGSTQYICGTDFYNDKAYPIVDSQSIEKPYNFLPLTARAQWPLDGERSAYGGVTEGYDSPPGGISVTLTPGYREVILKGTLGTVDTTYSFTEVQKNINLPVGGGYYVQYTNTSDPLSSIPLSGADNYIQFTLDGNVYSGLYNGATIADYRAAVLDVVNQSSIGAYITADFDVEFVDDQPHTAEINVYPTNSEDGVTKVRSLKTNAHHPFCVFYYDDPMRRIEPQIQAVYSTVYIPSIPEASAAEVANGNPALTGTNYQQYVTWQIHNDAPSWAKYWRWGYAGNRSISLFWQYNVDSIGAGSGDWSNFTAVDISSLQTITDESAGNTNLHPDSNISSYVFEDGDRLKVLTKDVGATYDTMTAADATFDYEIKAFDDINHIIYLDGTAILGPAYTDYTGDGVVIEIYRPLRDPENAIFHEVGQMYEVYEDSGRYLHRGQTQDQTAGSYAEGVFNGGDVYLISRQLANGITAFTADTDPIFVESYHWSDFYDSDAWGKGKIGIVTGIGQKYLDNIRYGNKFSPNTLSSGLSEFDGLDYKSMSSETGKITAMRQAGHVLKVYFERNSASVMVNKTQLVDADGTSQVVKSDQVLGSVEYSNYHYGTVFPESVLLVDRTIYFYDIYRKAYVRDSSNGAMEISKYKAARKFIEMSEELLLSGVSNVQVWSAYDYERDFVYVMFYDSTDTDNDDVLIFNEKSKRWETRVKMKEGIQIGSMVRNLELDYRLTEDSETRISVASIDTTNDFITFTNLPPLFEAYLKNPTADQEWLCLNIDSFSVAQPPSYSTTGNYEESLLITGYDADEEKYTYTVPHGADTNWSVSDEVVFINPFRFFDFYNSNNFMIDKDDVTLPGEVIDYVSAGPMFIKSDGTYVCLVLCADLTDNVTHVVPFTSTDPETSWTSTDTILFTAADFDPTGTNGWPMGNVLYLEDEDKYLVGCTMYDGSEINVSLYKFDEDFTDVTYYWKVVAENLSTYASGCYNPSIVYHEGEYYIFYVAHGPGTATAVWDLRVIKSAEYDDFSGSTAVTIQTNVLDAEGADGRWQNQWFNSHIDACSAISYQDRIYVIAAGTSQYDLSGNRANRLQGLFEYNPSTGGGDVTRIGLVYAGMLDGAWPNTSWGQDHTGLSIFFVWDQRENRYMAAVTQEASSNTYKIGFATFHLDRLFDEEDCVAFALPNAIGTSAQDLVSFIGEDLYVHNGNESRGFFYNGLKKMVLDVIVNQNAGITKVLDSLTLNTNDGEWVVTNVDIPPTPNYPRGMTSKIPNAFFEKRENGLHSEFLRNMKTSSNTASILELREGDELRGQTATITLENAESGEVVLFDILVNMSDSKI